MTQPMHMPMRTRSQYFAAASAAASGAVAAPAHNADGDASLAPDSAASPPYAQASSSPTSLPKVKIEYEYDPECTDPSPPTVAAKRKTRTPKSKHTSATTIPPPPTNWADTYARIDHWRATGPVAPVDTAGCTSLAQGDPNSPTYRFHTLVALMLSSQTKDEITATAMRNLQALDLTVDNVLAWSDDTISQAIGKVGFWRRKTEYIKKTARILKDKYNGDIPKTIEELMALPGVGPKMGYLALQVAWGINDGIGVDVHVHRISNRLGWTKTATPEDTRKALESWLPRDKWPGINPMLVGFGQVQCLPVRPLCVACPIADVCPSNSLALPQQQQQPSAARKRKAPDGRARRPGARKRPRGRDSESSSEEEVLEDTSESEPDGFSDESGESALSSMSEPSDSD